MEFHYDELILSVVIAVQHKIVYPSIPNSRRFFHQLEI